MKRLIEIQNELKAPKNQRNSFGGYNYRSCEDILEAVKPLLKKYECTLIIKDDIIHVGDRYYVQATAALFDAEGRQFACTTALAREEENKKGMDASQLTGATSSYARKYALNGLFAIDDTKDADATNTHGKEEKPVKKTQPKEEKKVPTEVIKELLKSAKTVDYLNQLWLMYKDKAEDLEIFKQLCADKKAEIMKGKENE